MSKVTIVAPNALKISSTLTREEVRIVSELKPVLLTNLERTDDDKTKQVFVLGLGATALVSDDAVRFPTPKGKDDKLGLVMQHDRVDLSDPTLTKAFALKIQSNINAVESRVKRFLEKTQKEAKAIEIEEI